MEKLESSYAVIRKEKQTGTVENSLDILEQLPHNPAIRIKCNSIREIKALGPGKKSMQKLVNEHFYQHYSIAKR